MIEKDVNIGVSITLTAFMLNMVGQNNYFWNYRYYYDFVMYCVVLKSCQIWLRVCKHAPKVYKLTYESEIL